MKSSNIKPQLKFQLTPPFVFISYAFLLTSSSDAIELTEVKYICSTDSKMQQTIIDKEKPDSYKNN